jgi:nitronate monooxygenase
VTFLNLEYPILQAPIGSIASTNLASAVSNAGGMGSLALTWTKPDVAAQLVRELRDNTDNLFFVNFVLGFPLVSFEAVLEAGAPAITFSWGQPSKLIDKVHKYNSLVGVQVGTGAGAKQAIDDGADFIICQGVEAGGHVQSTTPLSDLLPSVVEIAGSVPIVAAGGLSNGKDLAWALNRGASAVMLGTRFVATLESFAHPDYKQALVEAKSADSIYTQCYNRLWPNASHRVLRNKTLDDWETAGCPQPGQRPGEDEVLAEGSAYDTIIRYDDSPPVETTKGHILECCLYAGTGCGSINNIPPAAQLLSDIWSEYQETS